tara:strand:+ start:3384 stop:8834 length:5451 start_codon:yes stop_codon:yes gene_type:complete
MINVTNLVSKLKDDFPDYYGGMKDSDVYQDIRKKKPDLAWPENNPYEEKHDQTIGALGETRDASKEEHSPKSFTDLLTVGLPEVWADQHDWAKRAYNNSMAGLLYQAKEGKPKYEVDEYSDSVWEDVGGFFVGLVSPVDIAMFAGAGLGAKGLQMGASAVGKRMMANKTAKGLFKKGVAEGAARKVRNAAFRNKLITQGAMDTAFGLGTFGAAGGALNEAVRQSEEGAEDYDWGKIAWEGTRSGIGSAILGAAAGGLTRGIMAPRFARAQMASKAGDNTTKTLVKRMVNNPASQVLAEAGVFTGAQLTEQALGGDVSMDDFWRSMASNIGMTGGMRAIFKPLRLHENDVTRYTKAKRQFMKDRKAQLGQVHENIEKTFDEAKLRVPEELRDEIIASNLKNREQREAFSWMLKNEDRVKRIGEKDFRKLSPEKQAEMIQKVNQVNTLRMGMYSEALKNKDIRDFMFKEQYGKVPSKSESAAFKNKLEKRLNEHVNVSEFLNNNAFGDKKRAKRTLAQIEIDNRKKELRSTKLKEEMSLKQQVDFADKNIKKVKADIKFENELSSPSKKRISNLQEQLDDLINIKESAEAELPAAKQARANIELDTVPKTTKLPVNIFGEKIPAGKGIKIPTDKTSVVLDKKQKGFVATNTAGEKVGVYRNEGLAKQATQVFKSEQPGKKFNEWNKKGYVSNPEKLNELAGFANFKFDKAVEHLKLNALEKKGLKKALAGDIGIDNKIHGVTHTKFGKKPIQFKQSEIIQRANDIAKFVEKLETSNIDKFNKRKNIVEYFRTAEEVKNYETKNKISKQQQKESLKEMGVPDGDITRATNEQIRTYRNSLFVEDSGMGKGTQNTSQAIITNLPSTAFERGKARLMKAVAPFEKVAGKFLGKEYAERLRKVHSIQADKYGDYLVFESDLARFGWTRGDGRKIAAVGEKAFIKHSDNIHILGDRGQKYLQSKKIANDNYKVNGIKLSNSQIKELKSDIAFFERAVNVKKWMKTVDKDGRFGDGLNKSDKNVLKYTNYDTVEGAIYGRYADPKIGMASSYRKSLETAVRANKTDAEYQYWKRQKEVKWVDEGLYITNQVTSDFKKFANLSNTGFEKIIRRETRKIAKDLAQKEYKTKNPSSEQIEKFRSQAETIARDQVMGMNNFTPNTMQSKFLIERDSNLSLFVEGNNGKLIRTFDRSWDNTGKRYALKMSQHIAGMEVFPEYVKASGSQANVGLKIQLPKGSYGQDKLGLRTFLQEGVEEYLGINQRPTHSMAVKASENTARFLAKTQLSSPLARVKNITLGNIANLWGFDYHDIARGYSKIIFKEQSRALIKGGHADVGVNIYEGRAQSRFGRAVSGGAERLFKLGGMKPSEKFMRHLTVLTSKTDQARHIDYMRNHPKGSKMYNKGLDRLKNFYEASDADINLLKKYGFEPPKDKNGNYVLEGFKGSNFEKMKTSRLIENAHQYLDVMAHTKTQGSSASIFMPKVASGKYMRPLTLFKRMAYAATINTGANVRDALKAKDASGYLRLAAGSAGTYFGGQTMIGFYKYLLGTPMPKENSSWFDNLKTVLWRGEFLGILSDVWSPFESSYDSQLPVIMSAGTTLAKNLYDAATEKKDFWGKGFIPDDNTAMDEIFRRTLSAYNFGNKLIESKSNPYSVKSDKFRTLYNDFEKEFDPGKVKVEYEATERTPYYKALRNAFEKGNAEEFAESFVLAYYALASDKYQKGYDIDGVRIKTMNEALRASLGDLKKQLKKFNPTKRPSSGSERDTKIKYIKFRQWLDKNPDRGYVAELDELNQDYADKMKDMLSQFPGYLKKNNLKSLIKEFDFS